MTRTSVVFGERLTLNQLAPGVFGHAVTIGGCLYITYIEAEKRGSGDVGRYLDGLTGRVRIPYVLSKRLAQMLERRGFREFVIDAKNLVGVPVCGDKIPVWERAEYGTPLQAETDPEYLSRIDADRVTVEMKTKSQRSIDAGKQSILDSPLFGGERQKGMFPE